MSETYARDGAPLRVTYGGRSAAAVALNKATDTVIKASAGVLCSVLLTSANGAAAILIFDNASGHTGTIIGYIPANAAIGSLYSFQFPAVNGITIQGAATNGALTITFD